MTEPLDAELLKDLRGLGKPPSSDGTIQVIKNSGSASESTCASSARSLTLMNKCEAERNQVTVTAVKTLGDAHLKCCIQMYYSLASIAKGSVRTLVRSVEETEPRHGL